MSKYYASADGMILFKRELSGNEILDIKTEFDNYDIYAFVTPTSNDYGAWVSRVELSSIESLYRREDIEQVLCKISEMAPIKYGDIEYEGNDKELWRFIYRNGKWVYQKGRVIYEDEEEINER